MQYYISSLEENMVQCYRSSLSDFLTIWPDLVLAPSVVPLLNLVTGCLSVGPEVLALTSLTGLTTLPDTGTDPGFDTLPLIGIGFTLGVDKGVKVMDKGQMSCLLCETMVPDSVSIRYAQSCWCSAGEASFSLNGVHKYSRRPSLHLVLVYLHFS